MNIHEKHSIYSKLKTADKEEIKRDIALLEQKNPKSSALQTSNLDMIRKEQDVLWNLLDVATVEEIKSSRSAGLQNIIMKTPEGELIDTSPVVVDDVVFSSPEKSEQSQNPDIKKKAKKRSTPKSSGKKTKKKTSKKQ